MLAGGGLAAGLAGLLLGGAAADAPPPQEFEVRGLVIPHGGVVQ